MIRFAIALLLPFVTFSSAKDAEVWSVAWQAHLLHPEDRGRFQLVSLDADRESFVGWAWFENYIKGNPDPPPAKIPAVRSPAGVFWPVATLQVGDALEGPWETVGHSRPDGERTSIIVAPGAENHELYVDLSAFRPLLRQKTWGRILLETGDAALIELKELLPPQTGP